MNQDVGKELNGLLSRIADAGITDEADRSGECCTELKDNFGKYLSLVRPDNLAAPLRALKAKRRFAELTELTETALVFGIDDAGLRNLYAVALINNHQLMAADTILSSVLTQIGDDKANPELRECLGLRGRVWKDVALLAIDQAMPDRAQAALKRSYDSYRAGLALAPKRRSNLTWAGINLIGLARIARNHGIELAGVHSSDLPEQVLNAITSVDEGDLDCWDLGTAIELSVARADWDRANDWLDKFLKKDPDPFHRASIERQLARVWNVNGTKQGAALYQLLLGDMIAQSSGFISADAADLKSAGGAGHEAFHGGRGGMHIDELRQILHLAKSVALVCAGYRAIGTGFVLAGKSLGFDDQDCVLLTNSHVVSEPPERDAAVPGDVQLFFKLSDSSRPLGVGRVLFNSGLDQHDVSILEIEGQLPADVEVLRWGERPSTISPDDRAYVIGHPYGQETTFSIENSNLIAVQNPDEAKPQRLHYRSATDFGNSGSPIFNQNWKVIGIHSRGRPSVGSMNGKTVNYKANEGITIQSINAKITKDRAHA